MTDNKVFSGGLHHVDGAFAELLDFDYPLHLCQETCEQAKVAAGEPGNHRRDFWRDLGLGQLNSGRRPVSA